MKLTSEQLSDIRAALIYYQRHHISITSPRYNDYKVILQLLENYKDE